ncbi:50S ribosomal protein L25, partial [Candidatus Uhrbacteria bacterium]|nr:50S ribosomal protein L25 [Candidatus Uhrbacteria bacterium]
MKMKARVRTAQESVAALRAQGEIPAVIYGGGRKESTSLTLNGGEFMRLKKITSESTMFDVEIDGETVKALLGEVQYHPLSDDVLHVDFRQVNLAEPIEASVP